MYGMESNIETKIQNKLLTLSPIDFEQFVGKVWDSMGWQTDLTSRSNDEGIDIIAEKSDIHHEKAVIQVKRYSYENKIGRPDIQQYDTLRRQESNVDFVIVVTTGYFTQSARDLANDLNVKLVNGEDIADFAVSNLEEDYLKRFTDDVEVETSGDNNHKSEKKENKSENEISLSNISADELSDYETELATVYESHWEEKGDKYGTPPFSLVFKFQNEQPYLSIYQFVSGLHSIEFTESKRRDRAAKTAEKYGWEVESTGSGLFSQGNSNLLNVRPNGSHENNFDPILEARFTKIVIERFLDSSFEELSCINKSSFDSGKEVKYAEL